MQSAKSWKRRLKVSIALTLACTITLLASPFGESARETVGRMYRGWEELGNGPVEGICALIEGEDLSDLPYPVTIGRPHSDSGNGRGTIHFVVRMPKAYDVPPTWEWLVPKAPRAFVKAPNASENPAQFATRWQDGHLYSIIIPPRFAPDTPFIDIRVALPDLPDSVFRVYRLPKTVSAVQNREVRESIAEKGVAIHARAYRAPQLDRENCETVGAGIRVDSLPAEGSWELRDFGIRYPYSCTKTGSAVETTRVAVHKGLSFVMKQGEQFAGQVDRLILSGALRQYVAIEEELDFGEVGLGNRGREVIPGNPNSRVDIGKPIARTTPSGFTLTLMPEGHRQPYSNMSFGVPSLVAVFRVDSDPHAGFKSSSGETRISVSLGDSFGSELSFLDNGRDVPGQALFQVDSKLLGKTLRMRVKVTRSLTLDRVPFEFVLPVEQAGRDRSIKAGSGICSVFDDDWPPAIK